MTQKVLDDFAPGDTKNRQFLAISGTCAITEVVEWAQLVSNDLEQGGKTVGFIVAKPCREESVEGVLIVKPRCPRTSLDNPEFIKVGSVFSGRKGGGKGGAGKVLEYIKALQQCTNYSTLKVVKSTPPVMAPVEIQQELQDYANLPRASRRRTSSPLRPRL